MNYKTNNREQSFELIPTHWHYFNTVYCWTSKGIFSSSWIAQATYSPSNFCLFSFKVLASFFACFNAFFIHSNYTLWAVLYSSYAFLFRLSAIPPSFFTFVCQDVPLLLWTSAQLLWSSYQWRTLVHWGHCSSFCLNMLSLVSTVVQLLIDR